MYQEEAQYYHQMDLQAQYEVEMQSKAQAEAEYEAEMWKIKVKEINDLKNLYDEKLRELDKINDDIRRLESLL